MNGLTPDRVTRLGAWRNSTRRSLKAGAGNAEALRDTDSHPTSPPLKFAPDALGRAVEMEVIPRLMVAHRPSARLVDDAPTAKFPLHADVLEFSGLIATQGASAAWAWVEARMSKGTSLESLFLNLLIPSASHLSHRWQADLCHFEEIALGMLNLQHVLHGLSSDFASDGQSRPCGHKALLLSAPGEQNMLGTFMVTEFYRCVTAEFFHRAGWEVWRAPPASRSQLAGILEAQWFDVIDVAASCEGRLQTLSTDVADMRRASRNGRVSLTVSGPAFDVHPEFGDRVGADGCACDPRDTLAHAETLVALREREGSDLHRQS